MVFPASLKSEFFSDRMLFIFRTNGDRKIFLNLRLACIAGGSIMAEIKSAIELAMEKTKGLRLSQEEMEHLQEEEMQTKAHGLVNRFLEVDFHFKEVEKELARFSSNQRKELEGLLIQYLGEALQLDKDNELIFQGIETLREGKKRVVQRIRDLTKIFQVQREKEYREVEKELLAKLERQGISGSAVQPKVEGSAEWEEALSQFKPAFEEQLRIFQKELIK
jgi:hypothetical protein